MSPRGPDPRERSLLSAAKFGFGRGATARARGALKHSLGGRRTSRRGVPPASPDAPVPTRRPSTCTNSFVGVEGGRSSGSGGMMSSCWSSPWSRSGCPRLGRRRCAKNGIADAARESRRGRVERAPRRVRGGRGPSTRRNNSSSLGATTVERRSRRIAREARRINECRRDFGDSRAGRSPGTPGLPRSPSYVSSHYL